MNKQLNNLFIKQLIDLDFPFVKTLNKKEKLNSVTARISLKSTNQLHILDIFKMNNSLKQFLRILYGLKYTARGDSTNLKIYIWCKNKFILDLINIFIKKYKISRFIILCDLFPSINTIEDEEKQKLLFVLGDPWTEKPAQMLHARVLYNKIFLVNTLNFTSERPQLGFYRIQNTLSDYKKLMVILIMIDKVLGKSRTSETTK